MKQVLEKVLKMAEGDEIFLMTNQTYTDNKVWVTIKNKKNNFIWSYWKSRNEIAKKLVNKVTT